MKYFNVSKTYQTVTPESAQHGEIASQGYYFKDLTLSLREVLHEIKKSGVAYVQSYRSESSVNIYGRSNIEDLKTLEEETICIHVDGPARMIARLVKILKNNH